MAQSEKNRRPSKQPRNFDEILNDPQPLDAYKDSSYSSNVNLHRDGEKLKQIQGSLVGLAVGDALGAPVEFRPRAYLEEHPVKDMLDGGTWGLKQGQWTDDTSMALCLAASLIVKKHFDIYDQFDRYRRWYEEGYLSSVGKCFDIGKATREAVEKFIDYQKQTKNSQTKTDQQTTQFNERDLFFGASDAAGNGCLMRVAPIPLIYWRKPLDQVLDYTERATKMTHGDRRAIEASRYFAYLIYQALQEDMTKERLLDGREYLEKYGSGVSEEVRELIKGSYKKKERGYEDGIRGVGFVIMSLEAALWALYTDGDSFEAGVLNAVNLGDDTDTTAAIYGQLAGALYGIDSIPKHWRQKLHQCQFIMDMATVLCACQISNHERKSDWD